MNGFRTRLRFMGLLCLLLLPGLTARAAGSQAGKAACSAVEMTVERLPDLPVPLTYHHTLCVNGEAVVVGGHTHGFVPVREAYCLRNGKWQTIPMVYTHDYGFVLSLGTGEVLVAGGFEKEFGIGQSYAAELYNPTTHTFRATSILDTRRAMGNGIEMDSGRVVVSGNWYHTDNVEMFDGRQSFAPVKAVAQQRANPFVFRTSAGNALIVGRHESHGADYDTIFVDYLSGETACPPLLQQWRPLPMHLPFRSSDSFIGDEARRRYDYLMPVADSTGRVAIMAVRCGEFSLLETDCPIPMLDGRVNWGFPVVADRQRQRAYLVGDGVGQEAGLRMLYVLQIDYARTPARLTLHHATRPADVGLTVPALMPDGDLLMAGGSKGDNFRLHSSVMLLRVGDRPAEASLPVWLWPLLAALVAGLCVGLTVVRRRRRVAADEPHTDEPATTEPFLADPAADEELMHRIETSVKEERLYLNSDLKASDVAGNLGVSSRRVTDCVKACRGCSFTQFVNACRVDCACQLLHRDPDVTISSVWMDSGFSSESSFFRIFKAATGKTPKEWVENTRQTPLS